MYNKGFHTQDGLFFSRNEDGSVTVAKVKNGATENHEVVFEQTVDKDTWASVIASVSALGEGDGRFYNALEFHTGQPNSGGYYEPKNILV